MNYIALVLKYLKKQQHLPPVTNSSVDIQHLNLQQRIFEMSLRGRFISALEFNSPAVKAVIHLHIH